MKNDTSLEDFAVIAIGVLVALVALISAVIFVVCAVWGD